MLYKGASDGENGGVIFRVIAALVTLVVIGGAIFGLLSTHQQAQQTYHRKALEISEYGLMLALGKLHEEPSWRAGFPKTSYDDGWYKVRMSEKQQGEKIYLTITSEAGIGSSTDVKECVLSRSRSETDTAWVRESMH